jgi:hypothetical protein
VTDLDRVRGEIHVEAWVLMPPMVHSKDVIVQQVIEADWHRKAEKLEKALTHQRAEGLRMALEAAADYSHISGAKGRSRFVDRLRNLVTALEAGEQGGDRYGDDT